MINLKLRLKNKATLLTLAVVTLTFIYTVLGIFNIVPSVSQELVGQLITAVIEILAALGIVIDPTTKGITDSDRALTYQEPK